MNEMVAHNSRPRGPTFLQGNRNVAPASINDGAETFVASAAMGWVTRRWGCVEDRVIRWSGVLRILVTIFFGFGPFLINFVNAF